MSQTDASRLREARKQCRIVLEGGDVDALMAADLDATIINLDGLIDALEAKEVRADGGENYHGSSPQDRVDLLRGETVNHPMSLNDSGVDT